MKEDVELQESANTFYNIIIKQNLLSFYPPL